MSRKTFGGTLALIFVWALALPANAQLQRGTIYGTLTDNTNGVLPGVTVTLTSDRTAPQTVVSGTRGEFRFAEIDPGSYTITATLQGFATYTRKNITVTAGASVSLPIQMVLPTVEQQVTVTAPSPMLDPKVQGNNTTFGDAALNEIPTARDPWVLLQQVPGVNVDRVNVGGSASGQQSSFTARGDAGGVNTMWNIDGVNITDNSAIGASPTYYNFDVFSEVQFNTSGTDPRSQTGGLSINMVTKRGTNDFHGLARMYFTNHSLQATNIPSDLAAIGYTGNRINQISDYGGDFGGPLMKDKLWFWASAARNDIRQFAITGAPDNTKLTNYAAKADAQLTSADHFNFMYFRGNKEKIGRNASVSRPPETTWNQTGPTDIYKVEDQHVVNSNLMVSGKFAYVKSGFSLTPQGGLGVDVFRDASGGIWHNSFQDFATERPEYQTNVDGSYFKGMHEVKIGFQYRRTPVTSSTTWPGSQTWTQINNTDQNGLPTLPVATLTRQSDISSVTNVWSLYGADTILMKKFTIDLGLRWDRQNGFNNPAASAPNGLAPDLLPALNYAGGATNFTWNNVSPRVGATYRIDDKTQVRGSYALFAGQLAATAIQFNNAAQLAGVSYNFIDSGSHQATPGSLVGSGFGAYGFDPANPAAPLSPRQVDPNLKAPTTQSVVAGLDREVMSNLSVSTSFGWGRTTNLLWTPYIGLTSADFVQTGVEGPNNTPVYGLAPGVELPNGGAGIILTNRPGYHQRYWNWDVTMTKRMSNHWMARAYVTLQNNQEFFDNPSVAIQDPTPRTYTEVNTPFDAVANTTNGGILSFWAGGASGAESEVYINSKWSYSLMGMYELPYGIGVSGTIYGRQGYPSPQYVSITRDGGLSNSFAVSGTQVLVDPNLDAHRNPNLTLLDLRAEKSFTFGKVKAIGSVDFFNIGNVSTLLQVGRQVGAPDFGIAREIVPPRVIRFGLRIQM
jgi:hypothetical protein